MVECDSFRLAARWATAEEDRLNIWRNPHTSFAKGPVPPGVVPSDGSVGAAPKRCPGSRGECRGIRHSGNEWVGCGPTPTTYTCWLTGTLYQNSKTLTHATYAATGTSIAKTYGSPVGYGRLARARTVVQMSQCLRSLVLHGDIGVGRVLINAQIAARLVWRRWRSAIAEQSRFISTRPSRNHTARGNRAVAGGDHHAALGSAGCSSSSNQPATS
jgi:hypothetical protein